MREILDMYDLHQHINIQTHKPGNTLDWLISNSPDTIHDITSKYFLSDHSIMEWNFRSARKSLKKMEITRRDLSKVNEESFMSDLKNNLDVDSKKTLQQNYNNYIDAIKNTIEKHAPLKTKTKTKKDHTHGLTRMHKSSKHKEGWPKRDGSNLNKSKIWPEICIKFSDH